MRKSIIVAASQNGIIGKDGSLPWRLPADLARFKALTMGHTLIMGRKTFESLPPKVRPLPGRRTIVLSRGDRDAELALERAGATAVYESWDSALYMAGQSEDHRDQDIDAVGEDEVFICGGGEVYKEALPLCDRVYLTVVERDFEGDTYFDDFVCQMRRNAGDTHTIGSQIWILNESFRHPGDSETVPYRFEVWDRVP